MRSRSSVAAMVAGALSLLGGTLAAPVAVATEPGSPVVAFWRAAGEGFEVVTADAAGHQVHVFRDFDHFSLGGSVLAGEVPGRRPGSSRIGAFDSTNGSRLYSIPDARLPVVVAGGRKTAFFPTFARDKMMRSVWMRTPTGKLRKIAKFAQPGHPGIRHGMRAGAVPLDLAFDSRGRYMALVGGLETIRTYDVWIVDVKTKEATRMTRGENSHNPSMSPDGSRVAVRVERNESCTDPYYGEIWPAKIRVLSRTTGESSTLQEWDCDLIFDTPRFLDDETLVAARSTRDATQEFGWDIDIVKIDLATGTVTELITDGHVCCITVSPTVAKVAHLYQDAAGFRVFDVATQELLPFDGEVHGPHLLDDSRF